VAVAGALTELGVDGVQLKWPNDIVAAGGKLGGILVEVAGEPGGPLRSVVGVGLNVRPIPGISAVLGTEAGALPALALDELLAGRRLKRDALVAALLNSLHLSLASFGEAGSAGFLAAWRRRDCLAGQPVVVTRGQESFTGVACGLGDDGSLLVNRDGSIVPVVAGDVTLRAPG
jgi:BirA family biotin operon repressor/biotin-[acetyl-CoA-carboxylase] ligase